MNHNFYPISLQCVEHRSAELVDSLVRLWESSVRATHSFLTEDDICEIRAFVPEAFAQVSHLVVAKDCNGVDVAFMGVADGMLEMLFVAPSSMGMGIGRRLVQYGIDKLGVMEVTVNEQNPGAVGFYTHIGFSEYKRTECDEQGRPFPLIYMRY